jgi:phospholipid/cholesterol/gamma-HCH transport system permease protein
LTPAGALRVILAGDWVLGGRLPSADAALVRLRTSPRPAMLEFDGQSIGRWDTGLVTTLLAIERAAAAASIPTAASALPAGAQRLLQLALAVPEREGARRAERHPGLAARIGTFLLEFGRHIVELVRFFGELLLAVGRWIRGRSSMQGADLALAVQEAGVEALPIVSLIAFLVGMIFAFVGVRQLEQFGAGIYVANLVAVAVVREMAPIMTAIIMAGRTGAAYAARLGTMKVNEEIDALIGLGINPIDFLVLPRVLALILMLPLLALYGGLLGILGGAAVSLNMLDVSLLQYFEQTRDAITASDIGTGLFKALVYGTLVAIAGCEQGMACGGSALAVGQATTKAVVVSIVMVIVSAAMLTVIYINLGI